MSSFSTELRRDALRIWQAGLEAVRSPRLVRQSLRVEGRTLVFGQGDAASDNSIPLGSIRRIAVVGGGKAGAGMAEAVEDVLGPALMAEKQLVGWVNVPADCVRPLRRVHLHAARPAGLNEPTPQGVAGTQNILEMVASLGPDDLCLCLISGGGSALLPAPIEGITLADKIAVTRHLSAAGANIEQLNTVRKRLSRIKGGGLLRACRAGRMISLILSDVLGDPLGLIASGPTVPWDWSARGDWSIFRREDSRCEMTSPENIDLSPSSGTRTALAILDHFHAAAGGVSPAVFECLRRAAEAAQVSVCRVDNIVIGNNRTAVDAAADEARRLGYRVTAESADTSEGPAEEVGRQLAERARRMRLEGGLACLVSGGEPTVALVDSAVRGLGGRNQQLVLASLFDMAPSSDARAAGSDACATGFASAAATAEGACATGSASVGAASVECAKSAKGVLLLSGSTDGEDGPTDAAGAVLDADVVVVALARGLDPLDHLRRNDAYNFFAPLDALLKTGPTHTNVCDVRVVLTRGE